MHKYLSLPALMLVPALASAGIYKWVDADGAVHFSDVPQKGAEEVHVAPPQTYSAPSLPPITPITDAEKAPPEYTEFTLAIPEPEANIWDNNGVIDVTFSITPPLQTDRGHKLVLLLDGQERTPIAANSLSLRDLDRGSHTLQGRIIDSLGKVLASSQSITVHVHRQSVNAPARNKPAP